MDHPQGDASAFNALRLGLDPNRVQRLKIPVTLEPETLVIRRLAEEPSPLLICLHPARTTEFQFAQGLRGLICLQTHLAFPRGLHAHEVDLGGAQTVGYAWHHYTGDNPAFRESLAFAIDYLDRVLGQLLDELPVDRRAIYLLGAGDGASTAAIFAVARSEIFAGVLAIGGRIQPEVLSDFMPETRRIPFLWLRSRKERGTRAEQAKSACKELRRMGFPVDLELLQQDGEPWQEEEGALISWLSQKAGVAIEQPV